MKPLPMNGPDMPRKPLVLGFAGPSGSGKTTLLAAVLPLLTAHGLSVSCIKHTHHAVDMDTPGKDTWIFREGGAREVILASEARFVLQRAYTPESPELDLDALVGRLDAVDVVLVEGFRPHGHPKILVYRPSLGKPLPAPERLTSLLAVATDQPDHPDLADIGVPLLPLNEPAAVAAFAVERLGMERA